MSLVNIWRWLLALSLAAGCSNGHNFLANSNSDKSDADDLAGAGPSSDTLDDASDQSDPNRNLGDIAVDVTGSYLTHPGAMSPVTDALDIATAGNAVRLNVLAGIDMAALIADKDNRLAIAYLRRDLNTGLIVATGLLPPTALAFPTTPDAASAINFTATFSGYFQIAAVETPVTQQLERLGTPAEFAAIVDQLNTLAGNRGDPPVGGNPTNIVRSFGNLVSANFGLSTADLGQVLPVPSTGDLKPETVNEILFATGDLQQTLPLADTAIGGDALLFDGRDDFLLHNGIGDEEKLSGRIHFETTSFGGRAWNEEPRALFVLPITDSNEDNINGFLAFFLMDLNSALHLAVMRNNVPLSTAYNAGDLSEAQVSMVFYPIPSGINTVQHVVTYSWRAPGDGGLQIWMNEASAPIEPIAPANTRPSLYMLDPIGCIGASCGLTTKGHFTGRIFDLQISDEPSQHDGVDHGTYVDAITGGLP